jgi:RNA polymerase sigma-70 factor (ECF subfamily)
VGREISLDGLDEAQSNTAMQQPLNRLLNEELVDKVREAVLNLPPLQREALILFEYEGLPLDEIASISESDVGAIKSRLYRAREGLKRTLGPYLRSNRELNSGREIVTLKEA